MSVISLFIGLDTERSVCIFSTVQKGVLQDYVGPAQVSTKVQKY